MNAVLKIFLPMSFSGGLLTLVLLLGMSRMNKVIPDLAAVIAFLPTPSFFSVYYISSSLSAIIWSAGFVRSFTMI